MSEQPHQTKQWQGKHLNVQVLFTRAGVAQQILVRGKSGDLLVDVGDGSLRDLLAIGYRMESLSGILITHEHFDHMGGLYSLLLFMWMIGRRSPLVLACPPGSAKIDAIVEAVLSRETDPPYQIIRRDATPREPFNLAGLSIEAYPVVHCGSVAVAGILGRLPAVGYRISCAGETVAITGDTGMCDSVRELVTDVDLAVIEATFPSREGLPAEMFERVHLSEDMAIELGRMAREYILVHRATA